MQEKTKGFKVSFREAVKTVSQIAEGVKNNIVKDKYIEELSAKRFRICEVCVGLKNGERTLGMKNKICDSEVMHNISGNDYTSGCGCFLELKTRAEEARCPAGKW